MKTKSIQLFLVLCCLSLSLSCEKDDQFIRSEESIKTVSLDQALDIMKQTQQHILAKSDANFITSISEEVNYEDLTNTDEELAVIPVTTQYSKLNSRLVLLTIDGKVQSAVVSLNPFEDSTPSSFSGEMLITDTKGNFVNGFRIEENVLVTEYLNDKKAGKSYTDKNYTLSKSSVDCDTCTFLECSFCDIGSVDLGIIERNSPPAPYVSITHMYITGGGGETSTNEWDLGASGPGYTDNTQEPEPEENTNPCEQINKQVGTEVFKSKKDESEGKTNREKETGYVENATGTFTELDPINGGHSLDISDIDLSNVNGFIHTHLDDFPTEETDALTGRPKINEIFRIFSPADLIAFLRIARSSRNANNVYATVITSTGDYTLGFTGNQADIIGYQGDSGNLRRAISSGGVESHVHIEVRIHDKSDSWHYDNFNLVDPTDYLSTDIDDNGNSQTNNNCI